MGRIYAAPAMNKVIPRSWFHRCGSRTATEIGLMNDLNRAVTPVRPCAFKMAPGGNRPLRLSLRSAATEMNISNTGGPPWPPLIRFERHSGFRRDEGWVISKLGYHSRERVSTFRFSVLARGMRQGYDKLDFTGFAYMEVWRRGRDSNPRGTLWAPIRFPVVLLRPLGHLSARVGHDLKSQEQPMRGFVYHGGRRAVSPPCILRLDFSPRFPDDLKYVRKEVILI